MQNMAVSFIGCYYHYAPHKCAKLMKAASRCRERWQPPNDEVQSTCKLWCNYYLQKITHSYAAENDDVQIYSEEYNHRLGSPSMVFIWWCVIGSTGQLVWICYRCSEDRIMQRSSRVQWNWGLFRMSFADRLPKNPQEGLWCIVCLKLFLEE